MDSYMTKLRKTTYVINCFDDVHQKSIDYKNRLWLRNHVVELNIRVSKENCILDDQQILLHEFSMEGRMVIQDGQQVAMQDELNLEKEAILLILHEGVGFDAYLYAPKITNQP